MKALPVRALLLGETGVRLQKTLLHHHDLGRVGVFTAHRLESRVWGVDTVGACLQRVGWLWTA